MSMSLNALKVLPALVLALVLEYSSGASVVSITSTIGKAASTRSVAEEWKEWDECAKERQCDNVTRVECKPQDESCAFRSKQKCMCACGGYQTDGTDSELYSKCNAERECSAKFYPGFTSCRRGDVECMNKCLLGMYKCSCECQQVTRAQASEAVAITVAATCRTPKGTNKERDGRCETKCEAARGLFIDECGDEGEECVKWRVENCACGCAGLPSTTHFAPSHEPDYKCLTECVTNMNTCLRDSGSGEAEHEDWCDAYFKKCTCACRAGAASSTDAAEYRTATEDRAQLGLCAYARSCHNATCGCLEGDAEYEECVSQCRDSCSCGCLALPVQPAGGRLTVTQCLDKREACVASCAGHRGCIDWCFLEKEVCNCQCAGRSSPPSPKGINQ